MNLDRTFFVTTVTWQRTPLFRNPQTAELMMDLLTNYREIAAGFTATSRWRLR